MKAMPIVTFVVGAAVGSVATWFLVKTKYEQLAQEEIDSVKEVFSRREKKQYVEVDLDKANKEDVKQVAELKEQKNIDIREYAAKLHNENYTEYSEIDLVKEIEKPYVITPEEFGEIDGYEVISLVYYADKILADDRGELIEDVDEIIGFESLGTFGRYEEDSVFVRNDILKSDYEILKDLRRYDEVIKKSHRMED